MIHDSMASDDALSMAMFLAGALMVFTPLVTAGVVVFVLWRKRRAGTTGTSVTADPSLRSG
jgi:hypothetical protein